jgi:CubicO group peptidase (beta-lactamase class C family)
MNKSLIIFLIFTCINCTSSQSDQKKVSQEEENLIKFLFQEASGNQPGANVLVIKDGKIIHQKSYGMANVEKEIKSIPETNYRIASVSKQFTAMGIMILEDQGKLSYESKLTEIFPGFPEYGKAINIRHLLTHQSGVIDYDEFIENDQIEQLLDKDVLDMMLSADSTYFTPGSQYRYSNSGYAILAQIVEKVSGLSFAAFMDKEIFKKLNMKDAQVFVLDKPIKNRAYGCSIENDLVRSNDQSITSAIQGDGGIYMHVMDYFKWDQALYTNKLIPLDKLEEAFYDWEDNIKTNKDGYGYGWSINYKNGTKFIEHSGGTAGFESRMRRIPSLNLSIIIFTNRDGHDRQLLHRINALTSIFSDYKIPMPVEIVMKKEIEQKGLSYGIEAYDKLKNDKRYEYNKTTPTFLGFEYYRLNDFKTAEAIFVKDTIERPNHFGGYYGLANVYKKMNEVDKAILNFEKIIEIGAEEEWVLDRARKELLELGERE